MAAPDAAHLVPPWDTAQATHDDWLEVRALRLQALSAEPNCFGTALATEASMTQAEWRRTLTENVWFVARPGRRAAGLVAFFPNDRFPDGAPQLGAMWVDPDWRGHGIARALAERVWAVAADSGAVSTGLWVAQGNLHALRVYERLGYRQTGASKPAPRDGRTPMHRMLRAT